MLSDEFLDLPDEEMVLPDDPDYLEVVEQENDRLRDVLREVRGRVLRGDSKREVLAYLDDVMDVDPSSEE